MTGGAGTVLCVDCAARGRRQALRDLLSKSMYVDGVGPLGPTCARRRLAGAGAGDGTRVDLAFQLALDLGPAVPATPTPVPTPRRRTPAREAVPA